MIRGLYSSFTIKIQCNHCNVLFAGCEAQLDGRGTRDGPSSIIWSVVHVCVSTRAICMGSAEVAKRGVFLVYSGAGDMVAIVKIPFTSLALYLTLGPRCG